MTIYMMAILYVMHKLYITDHLIEEEIFAQCPPSRWKDISREEQELEVKNFIAF